MDLYRTIIYRICKCEKDYGPINMGDNFTEYLNLTNEMLNNGVYCETDNNYASAKRIYLELCIQEHNEDFVNKFDFYDTYDKNVFMSNEIKKHIFDIFRQIQKCYHGLLKFKELVKHKQLYKVHVQNDFGYNVLNINDRKTVVIIQEKKKYLFKINDLIKIIKEKLTSGSDYFVEPIPIKNPYTNICFSKANLYNIYFKMKFDTCYHNEILYQFFKSDFDICIFSQMNMTLLRETFINDRIINMSKNVLHKCILQMILYINNEICHAKHFLTIHEKYDKDRLILIFKPYYRLYLLFKYNNDNYKTNYYETLFFNKVKRFITFNNRFGKQMMRKSAFTNKYTHVLIDDSYVEFYEKEDVGVFMDNHITSNEQSETDTNVFYRDIEMMPRYINRNDSDSEVDSGSDSDELGEESEEAEFEDTPGEIGRVFTNALIETLYDESDTDVPMADEPVTDDALDDDILATIADLNNDIADYDIMINVPDEDED